MPACEVYVADPPTDGPLWPVPFEVVLDRQAMQAGLDGLDRSLLTRALALADHGVAGPDGAAAVALFRALAWLASPDAASADVAVHAAAVAERPGSLLARLALLGRPVAFFAVTRL